MARLSLARLILTAAAGVGDDLAAALAGPRAVERLGPCGVAITLGAEDVATTALEAACAVAARASVDVNLGAENPERKSLLFADMDSTMITVECVDELGRAAGVGDRIAKITEAAMRGEIDFAAALRSRVQLLRDLPEAALREVFDDAVRFSPGAETFVRTMIAAGARAELISGGFTFFTERVAAGLGFHAHRANRLEIVDGALTGRVLEPILGPDAKLEAFNAGLAAAMKPAAEALAIGDGANDLPMIRAAGYGVAYRAKPAVAAAADARLEFSDLTAALYLQGFREEDFAR